MHERRWRVGSEQQRGERWKVPVASSRASGAPSTAAEGDAGAAGTVPRAA